MPHTTLGEFSRATKSFRMISRFAAEMLKELAKSRKLRDLLEDSFFNVTQLDNHWFFEFDFGPTIQPGSPDFINLAILFTQHTGNIAKVEEAGLTTSHIWTNKEFNIKATFTHQAKINTGPETIEETKDGTGEVPVQTGGGFTKPQPAKKGAKK